MKTAFRTAIAAACLFLLPIKAANAAIFIVDALANSSSGGNGFATLQLLAGQSFSVTVNPNDLWSAGALPRWSNADGLTGNLFSTGTDESGTGAGTLIGVDFGLWAQSNLSAPYGSLVGRIGGGDFFEIGTSYASIASASGTLNLYYWDSNSFDNVGFIEANVTARISSAVPEPATWAMMLIGFAGLGLASQRRRNALAA